MSLLNVWLEKALGFRYWSASMSRISTVLRLSKHAPAAAFIAVLLAVLGNIAVAAQDKYTVKVPGGLSFSDFKGYEGWEVISLSHSEKLVAVILGNPAMIDTYKAGVPDKREAVP